MSDRWPGHQRGPGNERPADDPRPDWLEHEGASVFPTPPSSPPPPPPRPPPAPAAPTAPTAARNDWHERTRRATPWANPPSRQPPPPPGRPPGGPRGAPAASPPTREAWPPPPPAPAPPTRPYPAGPPRPLGPDPWGAPKDPRWDDPARRPWPPPGPGAYRDPRQPGEPGPSRYDPYDPYNTVDRSRRPAPAGRRPATGRAGADTPRPGDGGGGFRSPVGFGAVVGIAGAVAFVVALVVLPWFTVAGQDVTLGDIRSAYEVPATDPGSLPGSGGTDSTLPDGQIPTTDEVADVVEDRVRNAAATTAAQAIDGGKARYLELYVETMWLPVAGVVAVAAVVSTLLAPRSAALSLLLGVRRLAGVLVVLAGLAHAAALWIVFTGDGTPSPDTGVWIGVAGLVGVLAGCIIGPRR